MQYACHLLEYNDEHHKIMENFFLKSVISCKICSVLLFKLWVKGYAVLDVGIEGANVPP